MKKIGWTVDEIPSQEGRVIVVTGANSGLGYHTSRALAQRGGRVIMACRNLERGEEARQRLMQESPLHVPEVWQLDLASLDSVKRFAKKYRDEEGQLDLLINNAGLMAIPYYKTEDGFEMQFGVNHLGHFALSARLWPLLSATTGARLVQVSSLAHLMGKIHFEDIHWEGKYNKWGAYGMSKLANLLFIHELTKRLSGGQVQVIAAAAHPGYANTELQAKGAKMKGSRLGADTFNLANRLVAQSPEMGALPSLFAATDPHVAPGDYYGPGGFMRLTGWPAPDKPSSSRVNSEVARQLWELSEKLTGVDFVV